MDIHGLEIERYNYELPAERIADFPVEIRDTSKLLIYKNHQIHDEVYYNISKYIPEDSLIVFNNTKVVQARLLFHTSSGAKVEIFCLEPENEKQEIYQAMQQTKTIAWKCLVGDLKKWKENILKIYSEEHQFTITAEKIRKENDAFIIKFSWFPEDLTFAEILEKAGNVPLPPYIKRTASTQDRNRYQTVFAKQEGSVAAPTAGLHFTERVFESLKAKSIKPLYVTLHVGAGTFKPIKTNTPKEHQMHSEQIVVESTFLEELLKKINNPVTAVGTTSLRTLESLYWLGVKSLSTPTEDDLTLDQWDAYDLKQDVSATDAITGLIHYLDKKKNSVLITRTSLLILPGYNFKIVNILATNFHQPRTTLIYLVAAFVGANWKKIYDHALAHEYRFLSYGDGSLLFRK